MTYRDLFDDEPEFESMTMYEYEEAAMNTAVYDHPLIYPALAWSAKRARSRRR